MPEPLDDDAVDVLLSAAFAALPHPAVPPGVAARLVQRIARDTRTQPLRIEVREQRQGNHLVRVMRQTGARDAPVAAMPAPSQQETTKRTQRVYTTHVWNRKGTL